MATSKFNRFSATTSLDPPTIVAAARTVIEREGLDKLTMRRLGRELDVEAMSIYHHIPNKARLMELIVASVLEPVEQLTPEPSPYDTIAGFCRSLRSLLIEHGELAPLVVNKATDRLITSKSARSIVDQLDAHGFDVDAARWILESFVGFVAGHSMVELGGGTRDDDDAAFETGLRFMLAGLREELGD